ncbi:hypothetical protein BJV74DRAFT_904553 [Russula compacta]|nr:hypothetical protein BJV74DRAFT_904553 [Russula compacta]
MFVRTGVIRQLGRIVGTQIVSLSQSCEPTLLRRSRESNQREGRGKAEVLSRLFIKLGLDSGQGHCLPRKNHRVKPGVLLSQEARDPGTTQAPSSHALFPRPGLAAQQCSSRPANAFKGLIHSNPISEFTLGAPLQVEAAIFWCLLIVMSIWLRRFTTLLSLPLTTFVYIPMSSTSNSVSPSTLRANDDHAFDNYTSTLRATDDHAFDNYTELTGRGLPLGTSATSRMPFSMYSRSTRPLIDLENEWLKPIVDDSHALPTNHVLSGSANLDQRPSRRRLRVAATQRNWAVLQSLDKLTREDAQEAITQTLEVIYGLVINVKVVGRYINTICGDVSTEAITQAIDECGLKVDARSCHTTDRDRNDQDDSSTVSSRRG